jgi:hypothetical protein
MTTTDRTTPREPPARVRSLAARLAQEGIDARPLYLDVPGEWRLELWSQNDDYIGMARTLTEAKLRLQDYRAYGAPPRPSPRPEYLVLPACTPGYWDVVERKGGAEELVQRFSKRSWATRRANRLNRKADAISRSTGGRP